uniref:Uncharacterized protein LOC100183254 n=1 Tax=Phallusia mammillata TaxID=59560 RepID=A0A6F9DH48_9ASCI|nr:uncharacterized protein LOC100183254 [Phallusia mammillata]
MKLQKACGILQKLKTNHVKTSLRTVSNQVKADEQQFSLNGTHSRNIYQHSKCGSFTQDQPKLYNPYTHDGLLKSYLKRFIPQKHLVEIEHDLTRFGDAIVANIDHMGRSCELKQPTLTQFDAWGNRIDRVNTSEEWKNMKAIAATEGIIAHGYERKYDEWSRMYQMAKMFLFSPSSGMYSCPLAMVDGAAKVLESCTLDSTVPTDDRLVKAFRCLTSKDPSEFWTSGQWMTEKGGGSDVASGTDTLAYRQDDGSFKLQGYKWFTSATDADMALTLARIVDEQGNVPPGSTGLSLFYLETRDPDYQDPVSGLNGIQIQRLKDKLGTRQLPTGELLLDGTVAHLVGQPSSGVKLISGMLTLTRIHNSLWSAASMRRLLLLSKDYATKRKVFDSYLKDHPLHVQTLARWDMESRAAFLLSFEVVRLLGITEATPSGGSDEERDLLRIVTPLCKLYTAKQAVAAASEGLESFGGAGYLEDTGLPTFLRDAQVLSIWEGTTNVLSLDALRAIAKSKGQVLNSFFAAINRRLGDVSDKSKGQLRSPIAKVHIAAGDLRAFISQTSTQGSDTMFVAARDFSYSMTRIFAALLMLEHAAWEYATPADAHAAAMWCSQDLCPAATQFRAGAYSTTSTKLEYQMVFDDLKK